MRDVLLDDRIPDEDSLSGLPGRPPRDRDDLLNQLKGDRDLMPDTDLAEALIGSDVSVLIYNCTNQVGTMC